MIYITGDCHRNYSRFNTYNFPEQKDMTKDDVVIICGDFGGVWDTDAESEEENWMMDWLEGIHQEVQYTKWFFGHYHDNQNVNAQEILLYEQVIRIA